MYVRNANPVAQSERPTPSRHTRKKGDHSDESSADRVLGADAVELTQFNADDERRDQQQSKKDKKSESDESPPHQELDIKV